MPFLFLSEDILESTPSSFIGFCFSFQGPVGVTGTGGFPGLRVSRLNQLYSAMHILYILHLCTTMQLYVVFCLVFLCNALVTLHPVMLMKHPFEFEFSTN